MKFTKIDPKKNRRENLQTVLRFITKNCKTGLCRSFDHDVNRFGVGGGRGEFFDDF
jgi:hypothetical protein